jgi:hypothetical protein
MQSSKMRSWSPLLRIGAILAFVGVVTYGVSWPIHPGVPDASDWARSAQAYAESDNWVTIHLAQLFGLLFVFLGLAILAESLRREYRGTIVEAIAFLALVTTILTASVYAILQAVDGISLKAMVDKWANAPANEKAIAFRVSESTRRHWHWNGTKGICYILYGIFRTKPALFSNPFVYSHLAFVDGRYWNRNVEEKVSSTARTC